MQSRRGVENVPRDMAIYLTRRYCRKSLVEFGEHFGLSNYSTVSSAVERIKARKNNDRDLRQDLETIGLLNAGTRDEG
jgi:chromosomal replication initiation ATPase DnaA